MLPPARIGALIGALLVLSTYHESPGVSAPAIN
jgi:hypothetical protein